MKIIELYTKLANNEIIPRYIKVCERKYEFDEGDNEYYPRNENDNDTLLERISRGNVWAWLNTEVQELNSLEEQKKIPEKLENEHEFYSYVKYEENKNEIDKVLYILKAINLAEEKIGNLNNTINEIIDYLKSKGDE